MKTLLIAALTMAVAGPPAGAQTAIDASDFPEWYLLVATEGSRMREGDVPCRQALASFGQVNRASESRPPDVTFATAALAAAYLEGAMASLQAPENWIDLVDALCDRDPAASLPAVLRQAGELTQIASGGQQPPAAACEVTHWSLRQGEFSGPHLSGAASCPAGQVSFQIFDGPDFVVAGATSIIAGVFEAVPNIDALPPDTDVRFMVQAQ